MNYYIAITKDCSYNISYIYICSHEFHCMLATRLVFRCISKKLSKHVINNLISRYLIIHDIESNNSKIYFGSLEFFERWVEIAIGISLTEEKIVQVYEV